MLSGSSFFIGFACSHYKRFVFFLFVELRKLAIALSMFGAVFAAPDHPFEGSATLSEPARGYPEPLLLPDLVTLQPTDLRLVVNPESENKAIRFSNHILNRGPGMLEMIGQFSAETGMVHVSQVIFGDHFYTTEKETGIFYYHDSHSHWHWEGFSEYRVWSVSPSGSLENIVASSDKVGYCLEDVALLSGDKRHLIAHDQPPPTDPQYTSCFWRRQGLSIGWVDIYRSHIPGQSIDISHLEDGLYALQSTVDPVNLILEGNDTNNSSLIYFFLQDNKIGVLNRPPAQLKPPYSIE